MAQPPASPYIPRILVRPVPFCSQSSFNCDASGNPGTTAFLANGAHLIARFDVGLKVTDQNQFLGGVVNSPTANPDSGASIPFAIGTLLDALWTADAVGSVTVSYAVDYWTSYHSIVTIGIVAGITDNISGLRITGRFVKVDLVNTSGGNMTVDFGVYVRGS